MPGQQSAHSLRQEFVGITTILTELGTIGTTSNENISHGEKLILNFNVSKNYLQSKIPPMA